MHRTRRGCILKILNGLETRAQDVVEVNIDGKMLDLAKRVMVKVNDEDAKKVGQAINGLKGIYVRVYNFANENEYNVGDVEQIQSAVKRAGLGKTGECSQQERTIKKLMFTRCSPAT